MATEVASVRTLIREVVHDARDLVHQEVTLARTEAREQIGTAKSIGIVLGAATVLAVVGVALFAVALSSAITALFGIPLWASYAGMAVLLSVVAYFLATYGRQQLTNTEVLPKTKASLRETMAWIQSKSNSR